MKFAFSVLCVSAFLSCAAFATADYAAGGISGVVVSQDGLRLPGATVVVRNVTTQESVAVTTNDQGAYRVSSLRPGTYAVAVAMPGFEETARERVELAAGQSLVVDFVLQVAGIQEAITVAATLPRDSLEGTQVRASSGRDIGEALSEVTGITKVRKGGIASDVVLRGYQGRNLTVLIDGVRLYGACPNNMDPTAFHADFAEVERIDVGKGPFDVRNQGSLGGVLNVVTKRPQQGAHLDASLSAGSYSFVNPSATMSYGGDRYSVLGGASFRRSDPMTDGAGRSMLDGAGYKPVAASLPAFSATTAWAKGYVGSATGRSLQVAYTRQDAGRVLYPYLQMDAVSDVADRANVAYQASFAGRSLQAIRAQGYYSGVHHFMTDEVRLTSAGTPRGYSMATDARTAAFGGKAEASFRHVDVGFEAFQREWDGTTVMARSAYQPQHSIPGGVVRVAGAYAEYTRMVGRLVRTDLGARLDQVRSFADPALANTDLYYAYNNVRSTSASDLAPSFKARATVQAAPGLEISAGVGRTVRVPDPQERYFALKRMGSDWVGNPALTPTTNLGFDLGATYRYRRLLASVSGYYDTLAAFVTVHEQVRVNTVPGVMNTLARSFANVDARMLGAELDGSLALTDQVSVSGNFSYTRGTRVPIPALDINSSNLAEMPPARGGASLNYQSGRFAAQLQGVVTASQQNVDADLGESPTPGYAVMNARASWKWGRARLTAAVNNLFDRDYYEHLSYQRDPFRSGVRVHEPGRNLYVNLAVGF